MTFIRPVKVGDVLEVFTDVESIGRTSMKIHIEAWVKRFQTHADEKVTDATFTFVAIDENGKPRPIPKEGVGLHATITVIPGPRNCDAPQVGKTDWVVGPGMTDLFPRLRAETLAAPRISPVPDARRL